MWIPIGHNDAMVWPSLSDLLNRTDPERVDQYLTMLAGHGVNCLRLMLEYCHFDETYFETKPGVFNPVVVQFFDDLVELCQRHNIKLLLTPYDTFWMWQRWQHHPYNVKNGGPCADRSQILTDPETRKLIKGRLAFAATRWGGSEAVYAWDLWNELHPSYAGDNPGKFAEYIEDISPFLKDLETRLYGKAHPHTVSVFGPLMIEGYQKNGIGKPIIDDSIPKCIFRHPMLDFANSHAYEYGTIDDPQNTVDAAIAMARLTKFAVDHITDDRPFFDSEHGPIHSFKDKHITLPEAFDDEYFRHMQWAHLAAGGIGGGMRWPNRNPHVLTPGMHRAQLALRRFVDAVDWDDFKRHNITEQIKCLVPGVAAVGSADKHRATVWLLRTDQLLENGMVNPEAEPLRCPIEIPGLSPGSYTVRVWETRVGQQICEVQASAGTDKILHAEIPNLVTDLALVIEQN